jgi:hypothetical protein
MTFLSRIERGFRMRCVLTTIAGTCSPSVRSAMFSMQTPSAPWNERPDGGRVYLGWLQSLHGGASHPLKDQGQRAEFDVGGENSQGTQLRGGTETERLEMMAVTKRQRRRGMPQREAGHGRW